MSTYDYIGNGNPDGTIIGYSSSELIAFHGATPCDQAAAITSAGTTVAVSTTSSIWGFATSTQANALTVAVDSIITALKDKGILASA